jgi:hypothetical protein
MALSAARLPYQLCTPATPRPPTTYDAVTQDQYTRHIHGAYSSGRRRCLHMPSSIDILATVSMWRSHHTHRDKGLSRLRPTQRHDCRCSCLSRKCLACRHAGTVWHAGMHGRTTVLQQVTGVTGPDSKHLASYNSAIRQPLRSKESSSCQYERSMNQLKPQQLWAVSAIR